jgi:hypothetical protein
MPAVTEEQKRKYLDRIYEELMRRGVDENEIPRVIGKTGFMSALNDFPEAQLHYSAEDAVDEILVTAALSE